MSNGRRNTFPEDLSPMGGQGRALTTSGGKEMWVKRRGPFTVTNRYGCRPCCLTTTLENVSKMRCLPVRVTKGSNFISIRVWQGHRSTPSTEHAIQPQIQSC